MTKDEFISFYSELTKVCHEYGILIYSSNERRDSPNPHAVYFHEIGLRAKIESARGEVVMEVRKINSAKY